MLKIHKKINRNKVLHGESCACVSESESVFESERTGPEEDDNGMQVCHITPHGRYVYFIAIVTGLALMVMGGPYLLASYWRGRSQRSARHVSSVWAWRGLDGEMMLTPARPDLMKVEDSNFDTLQSPFIITRDEDKSDMIYTSKGRGRGGRVRLISTYDPASYVTHLMKTDFSMCEYSQCQMTRDVENADAVIFMVARLTRILYKNKDGITKAKETPLPTFRRRPDQIWVMRTDEAPSRFSWFKSLDRPGLRETFNWTMTHKLDSDMVNGYGYLVERDQHPVKNYDKIFDGKTRSAAWFVSHCTVRSKRTGYVEQMSNRTDVDVFGMCGTHKCGTAPKGAGIVSLRIKADKEECMPLMSERYKFYLAFENSLCQEYITEKFYKLFNGADVIPVVRGGADYKRYFPPSSFVDASDFRSPEALGDFLEDLGRDRERYTAYLKAKDRFRSVPDFPEWQCKLCKKLHQASAAVVRPNVHSWWTDQSCHDDVVDSLDFL